MTQNNFSQTFTNIFFPNFDSKLLFLTLCRNSDANFISLQQKACNFDGVFFHLEYNWYKNRFFDVYKHLTL